MDRRRRFDHRPRHRPGRLRRISRLDASPAGRRPVSRGAPRARVLLRIPGERQGPCDLRPRHRRRAPWRQDSHGGSRPRHAVHRPPARSRRRARGIGLRPHRGPDAVDRPGHRHRRAIGPRAPRRQSGVAGGVDHGHRRPRQSDPESRRRRRDRRALRAGGARPSPRGHRSRLDGRRDPATAPTARAAVSR